MKFRSTEVEGAYVVQPVQAHDERGFFARTFSADDFTKWGLEPCVAECSIAYNRARGTLRGLHYQHAPHEETKLVRCTRGTAFDVAVDLRTDSPTYLRWAAVELSAENRLAFYIPRGCAHGYLTLTDDCELEYQISTGHAPDAARGVRWNDPAVAIAWPNEPLVISARDASYPDLEAHAS
jgi:dTDP-4-dehydrorhamnose 3,5-epimerase